VKLLEIMHKVATDTKDKVPLPPALESKLIKYLCIVSGRGKTISILFNCSSEDTNHLIKVDLITGYFVFFKVKTIVNVLFFPQVTTYPSFIR